MRNGRDELTESRAANILHRMMAAHVGYNCSQLNVIKSVNFQM